MCNKSFSSTKHINQHSTQERKDCLTEIKEMFVMCEVEGCFKFYSSNASVKSHSKLAHGGSKCLTPDTIENTDAYSKSNYEQANVEKLIEFLKYYDYGY